MMVGGLEEREVSALGLADDVLHHEQHSSPHGVEVFDAVFHHPDHKEESQHADNYSAVHFIPFGRKTEGDTDCGSPGACLESTL